MHQRFHRRIEALAEVFAHTGRFYAAELIDKDDALAIDFAIEELFTNLVKYQPGGGEVELRLERTGEFVAVELAGHESQPYDPTRAPDADVSLPASVRKPGGLGLHLTRRLVEHLAYEHDGKVGRTRFRRQLSRAE